MSERVGVESNPLPTVSPPTSAPGWLSRADKYLAVAGVSFQRSVAYRVAFLSSLAAFFLQAYVLYFIWQVVFQNVASVGGFSRTEMIAYLFVSQGIANLHSWYGAAERRLSERVGSGDIVTDLLRPLNFQWACFAEVTGQGLVKGGLVLGVLLVTSLWIGEIRALADLVYLPIFVLSVVLGFMVMYSISFLAGLASFWTLNYWGLFYAKKVVVDLLSGALVPLTLFPAVLQGIALILPFPSMVYVPALIYLGRLKGDALFQQLAIQVAWAIGLWVAAHVAWSRAIRKVTVQGG